MCQQDDKYLPFQRKDQYGDMGKAPQPLAEKIRLACLSVSILPFKLVCTASCITSFYLVCRVAEFLPVDLRRRTTTAFGKLFSRLCLLSLGFGSIKWIKVSKAAWDQQKSDRPAVGIVSNHCSHVDILVHMARSFPSFVARGGTESIPLIGLIS